MNLAHADRTLDHRVSIQAVPTRVKVVDYYSLTVDSQPTELKCAGAYSRWVSKYSHCIGANRGTRSLFAGVRPQRPIGGLPMPPSKCLHGVAWSPNPFESVRANDLLLVRYHDDSELAQIEGRWRVSRHTQTCGEVDEISKGIDRLSIATLAQNRRITSIETSDTSSFQGASGQGGG